MSDIFPPNTALCVANVEMHLLNSKVKLIYGGVALKIQILSTQISFIKTQTCGIDEILVKYGLYWENGEKQRLIKM